ncbi:hypothetical protein VNO77_26769 [Canavalia gladiata]|uniref:Uncharacterized protein n=1 Tax=Canavalia gladiata TaxID=3824 RepID=A0AAN9KVP7_CANGL
MKTFISCVWAFTAYLAFVHQRTCAAEMTSSHLNIHLTALLIEWLLSPQELRLFGLSIVFAIMGPWCFKSQHTCQQELTVIVLLHTRTSVSSIEFHDQICRDSL